MSMPLRLTTLAALLVGLFVAYAIVGRGSNGGDRSIPACEAHLKSIGIALAMYASDHADKLPPEDSWMSALKPYLSPEDLRCPELPPGQFGYAFREGLGGAHLATLAKTNPVIVFESTTTSYNVVSNLGTLPMPPRHPDGNFELRASGQVEAVKPSSAQH